MDIGSSRNLRYKAGVDGQPSERELFDVARMVFPDWCPGSFWAWRRDFRRTGVYLRARPSPTLRTLARPRPRCSSRRSNRGNRRTRSGRDDPGGSDPGEPQPRKPRRRES
jgi:hypothetical protein